jgi:hypothetical protein
LFIHPNPNVCTLFIQKVQLFPLELLDFFNEFLKSGILLFLLPGKGRNSMYECLCPVIKNSAGLGGMNPSKMLSANLQWEKPDVWTLSNYQSVLLDMMAARAYMNSETLFYECFRECFFHTFCIYDNLRYRFNALWCWIFVTVKIILKSGVETFSQKFSYSAKIF